MRDILRFSFILTIVALITTGALAYINEITKPKIIAQQEKELKDGLISVLPGVDKNNIIPISEKGQTLYYIGYKDDEKENAAGFAFLSESRGYSSIIRTLVGIDSSGAILAINILFQKETPGLGTRCEEIRFGDTSPWWQDQFIHLNATDVCVDKDGGRVESITGATITSRAITDGIAKHSRIVLDKLSKNNE